MRHAVNYFLSYNPLHRNFSHRRAHYKKSQGRQFFITQLLFIPQLLIACVLGLTASSAFADSTDEPAGVLSFQQQSLSSTATRVALIELYTSEGCSSCPPAEHWLSSLTEVETLWQDFVPVAFHVDYWDYIGWKDRFAQAKFSQRQRLYATEQGERVVYTPGMRLGGEQWRSWRRSNLQKLATQERPEVGVLDFQLAADGQFDSSFTPATEQQTVPRFLTVALLGLDLETAVKAGENRGKTLKHDFVVLDSVTFDRELNQNWQGELPTSTIAAPRYAIAAWVNDESSLQPIQAVGGLLTQ